MTPAEQQRRDALFAAHGPIVATVGFPRDVMAASPEHSDRHVALTFEPGEYEILETAQAIAIRRKGVRADTWDDLGESAGDYLVSAARDDLADVEYPEAVTRTLAIEPELVWLTNPSGNAMRVSVGRARTRNVVAVYVQLA